MITYALDATIISYYLRKDSKIIEKIDATIGTRNQIVIPHIVYYEVRRGLLSKHAPKKRLPLINSVKHGKCAVWIRELLR
ncbi:hypothetical protein FACS1894200_13850 [Spirochaetia bacterium]|nr:hypothetical protein FACS1894200_13850 [Spirochaetia bacterium]